MCCFFIGQKDLYRGCTVNEGCLWKLVLTFNFCYFWLTESCDSIVDLSLNYLKVLNMSKFDKYAGVFSTYMYM